MPRRQSARKPRGSARKPTRTPRRPSARQVAHRKRAKAAMRLYQQQKHLGMTLKKAWAQVKRGSKSSKRYSAHLPTAIIGNMTEAQLAEYLMRYEDDQIEQIIENMKNIQGEDLQNFYACPKDGWDWLEMECYEDAQDTVDTEDDSGDEFYEAPEEQVRGRRGQRVLPAAPVRRGPRKSRRRLPVAPNRK